MFWQGSCCAFLYVSNIKCWVEQTWDWGDREIIIEIQKCFGVTMNILLHLNGRFNGSWRRLNKLSEIVTQDVNASDTPYTPGT